VKRFIVVLLTLLALLVGLSESYAQLKIELADTTSTVTGFGAFGLWLLIIGQTGAAACLAAWYVEIETKAAQRNATKLIKEAR